MNENKKKMYDLSGPKTVEAMKKRHFDAYYCSTAAEAVKKALELIPKTDSVSWGGVMTVDELGLKQRRRAIPSSTGIPPRTRWRNRR